MINKKFSYKSTQGLPGGANELKKFITGSVSVTGYKSDSPDVDNDFNIIPSNRITMEDVEFPVLGIDNLGNEQMMMPGGEYTFPGDYVTELPQMGKGGLTQWFAEDWRDTKTGKECGRSGKKDKRRSYPACRPSKRVNETTPKTIKEMSSAELAKFKREKKSGKRIDYNHERTAKFGGQTGWLDTYQDGGVPKRVGSRPNPDGTVSTHLMRAETLDGKNWMAFPSLFQNSDSTWVDMSQQEDWMPIYEEAKRRGEVIDFGTDKEAALNFGKGSWKKDKGWLDEYQYGGHSVRPGETFYGIANKYGLGRQDLVQANPNINIDKLQVGQRIALPKQYEGEELVPGYFETKDKSIFGSTAKQPQETKKSKPSEDPLFTGLSKVQKTRRKELIEAADKVASTQKNPEALNKLLVMTAVMENTLGTDPKAYSRDYTRGPMSIDDIAYQDIFGVRKGAKGYTRSQKKAFNWLKDLGYDYKNMDKTLRSNDPVASMAAARLYYGRNPKALPSADDKDAMFDYYMDMYNKGGVDKYKGKSAYKKKWDKFYNDLYSDKKQYGGQTNWLENYN